MKRITKHLPSFQTVGDVVISGMLVGSFGLVARAYPDNPLWLIGASLTMTTLFPYMMGRMSEQHKQIKQELEFWKEVDRILSEYEVPEDAEEVELVVEDNRCEVCDEPFKSQEAKEIHEEYNH